MLSGGLRIGVSERLAKTSLSRYSNIPLEKIEKIWHGLNIPYINLFAWLDGKVNEPNLSMQLSLKIVIVFPSLPHGK